MVEKFIPGRQFEPVKDRKQRFDEINALVTAKGGWVTSIRGAQEITIDVLPNSVVPSEMGLLGFELERRSDGERLLATAITVDVLTEGTTSPIKMTHAGICRVLRYSLLVR